MKIKSKEIKKIFLFSGLKSKEKDNPYWSGNKSWLWLRKISPKKYLISGPKKPKSKVGKLSIAKDRQRWKSDKKKSTVGLWSWSKGKTFWSFRNSLSCLEPKSKQTLTTTAEKTFNYSTHSHKVTCNFTGKRFLSCRLEGNWLNNKTTINTREVQKSSTSSGTKLTPRNILSTLKRITKIWIEAIASIIDKRKGLCLQTPIWKLQGKGINMFCHSLRSYNILADPKAEARRSRFWEGII